MVGLVGLRLLDHPLRSWEWGYGFIQGVHMTMFLESDEGYKIWIPKRAETKQTFVTAHFIFKDQAQTYLSESLFPPFADGVGI